MQRFRSTDPVYAYSRDHDVVGRVEPGEVFEVECVEGWSGYFAEPADFTRDAYVAAAARKWAMVGPITVAGCVAGGAVAVSVHAVEVIGRGVCVYGPYAGDDPLGWWDDETAVELFDVRDARVLFDEYTALPARPMIGCLAVAPEGDGVHARLQGPYGGNMDCRELGESSTLVLPVFNDGARLYLGDCKALMSDGEIVAPPEVAALVTASAEPRERPPTMRWPRLETADRLTTIVSGNPLEWAARQAFRELLDWIETDTTLPRTRAALLMAMVADTRIGQVSNDLCTAYCSIPRNVIAPYARS
jgi:amidase